MFASRVGTNPKYVARLPSLLKVVLASKNTVNNPFLGLGHAVRVNLRSRVETESVGLSYPLDSGLENLLVNFKS
jgi:hypothetical protein